MAEFLRKLVSFCEPPATPDCARNSISGSIVYFNFWIKVKVYFCDTANSIVETKCHFVCEFCLI